jgi:hypothetical protein
VASVASTLYRVSGESTLATATAMSGVRRSSVLGTYVVAQLSPTCFQGEIRHGNGRHEHHSDEHHDGCSLVTRMHQTDGHERAQDSTEAGNRARESNASRPDCCWVYLQ